MTVWVLLALGGAAGALARYAVASRIHRRRGHRFPWGTLSVNVLGAFLLGAVVTGLADNPLQIPLSTLVATGLLANFTTFSTFSYEAVMLRRERGLRPAVLYVLGSTLLTVLALVAGMSAGALLS